MSTNPLLVGGVVGGGAAAFLGYYFAVAVPRRRRREEEERISREIEDRERAEADAAEPLAVVEAPNLEVLTDVDGLIAEFDTLRTFADVARWDPMASQVAESVENMCRQLTTRAEELHGLIATYRTTNRDPSHIGTARILKTDRQLISTSDLINKLTGIYEALTERVDMTPDNAKDQRALLKTLRAEKKELGAQKKEVKAAMASIRREARVASTAAQPSPWSGTYTRKLAAEERRSIRRAKEQALGPQEDEVEALDRQILAIDRRIAWVQRFGDEEESVAG